MNAAPTLHTNWRTVLAVLPGDADKVVATLAALRLQSVGQSIEIVVSAAADPDQVLANLGEPVVNLPMRLTPENFWCSVLTAIAPSERRTIVLRAGLQIPQHWDARLAAAGQRAYSAAAVAPMCTRHPLFSAFYDSSHRPGLEVDLVDQWLNDYVEGIEFEVPLLLDSCMLLQGPIWSQLPGFDSDRELFSWLKHSGATLVATDGLYVDDSQVEYSVDIGWLPEAVTNAYRGRHPLTRARHALLELSNRAEPPRSLKSCLPVQLHVGHSWGGGLGRWMEDFLAADRRHNHLVLRSVGDLTGFGQKISLYHGAEMGVPIKSWTLSEPIVSAAVSSFEYSRMLEEIIEDFGIESLLVSSFVGHSLDLLRTGLPTTCVQHDFFPFCPALYATFGDACQRCGECELRECSVGNPLHSFFKFDTNEHWLAVREQFVNLMLQENVSAIAPTQSVVARYRQLEPRFVSKPIQVIEHGLDAEFSASLAPERTATRRTSCDSISTAASDQRLRLLVLGRLSPEKGLHVLEEIMPLITEFADVSLLGTGEWGERFVSMKGVSVVESYHKRELGDLLRAAKPQLGLLLSIVPETFSYTLSELWAAQIPVLAADLGAFSDRIQEGVNGWLCVPTPHAVLEKLRILHADHAALSRVHNNLEAQAVRSAADMTADYAALETVATEIPLRRYWLPRRSYQNPYRTKNEDSIQERQPALHVDHQLPYRRVLAEFLAYSADKTGQSPRLPRLFKGALVAVLQFVSGWVAPK